MSGKGNVMFLISFLLLGCTNQRQPTETKVYFDIPAFFDQQIAQLYRDSFIVVKTSFINNQTDRHEMPWTDWKRDFDIFYASDINKTSFMGKYAVDTSDKKSNDSDEMVISYKATDPSLRTRLLEVTFEADQKTVKLLHIQNVSSSFLSTTDEDLFYEPLSSYVIKSTQQMKFFGGNTYAIKGDIVSKKREYF